VKAVGLFVQPPWASVSVWPCWAVPVIVGGLVFAGGGGGGVGCTSAVAADVAALPGPPSLLAVSWTFSVCPTSPATGTYVWLLAAAIATQPAPELSHCSHW